MYTVNKYNIYIINKYNKYNIYIINKYMYIYICMG